MNEVILLKYGEFFLKGLNRKLFENYLIADIKFKLKNICKYKLYIEQSVIILSFESVYIIDKVFDIISNNIFGIAYVCRSFICEKNILSINEISIKCFEKINLINKTFKICCKRSDKKFIFNSLDISKKIGNTIINKFNVKANMNFPDIVLNIEIRKNNSYIYLDSCRHKGLGGLPLNSSEKAISMISGGIDSPVSSYMMMKRGVHITYIHFYSYPYTSEQSKIKVEDLCKKLTIYNNECCLNIVNFTDIQEKIKKYCSEKLITILTKRSMLRITEKIAKKNNINAIITGESLGQVASQTINSINIINNKISLPILRPLIAMDKLEIINIAKKLHTYEISILPYEDCCTIFTPKHPKLKINLNEIYFEENKFDILALEKEIIDNNIITKHFNN